MSVYPRSNSCCTAMADILPDRQYTRQEVDDQADAVVEERKVIAREASDNDSRWRCYRYQVRRVSSDGHEQVAYLESCDPDEFVP